MQNKANYEETQVLKKKAERLKQEQEEVLKLEQLQEAQVKADIASQSIRENQIAWIRREN
jgi:hypothetical protein